QRWFVDAARQLLNGSWRIYEYNTITGILPLGTLPTGIVYSYSPLLALVLAPFVGLADLLKGTPLDASVGGGDQLAYRLIALPLLVADVLAMEQFRQLARAWRPAVDEVAIFLGILPTMLVTGFLQVSAVQDHHEGLILLLLLTTLRLTPRHLLWGGFFAGLALAAKHTTLLELLPIGAVLLLNRQATKHPWRAAFTWAGVALAVFGAFMLPPFLANPGAVVYAFVTLPQHLELFGPGLPGWIDGQLATTLGRASPDYALWHERILSYSNGVLVLVVAGLVGATLWWNRRRGRPVGLVDSRLLALVALAALMQIVLGKWIGGHYYQLPLALVLLWDTVRVAPRWPPIGLVSALGFRAITIALPLPGVPLPRGLALLGLFIVLAQVTLGAAWESEPAVPPPTDTPPGRTAKAGESAAAAGLDSLAGF
ncbi:MAG TPA: glycosyltransferase 87 family protein, partial [Chloroflexia bacterium]|nr:glycosyltransferase 87 family protein [Chloroflexia bacterium]